MWTPDELHARRCELKLTEDQVATAMTGRGFPWSAATVAMVEWGGRVLSDLEVDALDDILILAPDEPVDGPAGVWAGTPTRVVISPRPEGMLIEVTPGPQQVSPAETAWVLLQAIDLLLHPQ